MIGQRNLLTSVSFVGRGRRARSNPRVTRGPSGVEGARKARPDQTAARDASDDKCVETGLVARLCGRERGTHLRPTIAGQLKIALFSVAVSTVTHGRSLSLVGGAIHLKKACRGSRSLEQRNRNEHSFFSALVGERRRGRSLPSCRASTSLREGRRSHDRSCPFPSRSPAFLVPLESSAWPCGPDRLPRAADVMLHEPLREI